MPPPTRKIVGWGRPEVLMDGHWDEEVSEDWSDSESELEVEEPTVMEFSASSLGFDERRWLLRSDGMVGRSGNERDSLSEDNREGELIGTAF
jgi:hypothetical protein